MRFLKCRYLGVIFNCTRNKVLTFDFYVSSCRTRPLSYLWAFSILNPKFNHCLTICSKYIPQFVKFCLRWGETGGQLLEIINHQEKSPHQKEEAGHLKLALKAHPHPHPPVISGSHFGDLVIPSLEGPFLLPKPPQSISNHNNPCFNPLLLLKFLANLYSLFKIQPRRHQSEDFPFLLPTWHSYSLGSSPFCDDVRPGTCHAH